MTKKNQEFLTCLLNWYANPYHAPIFIAKELGFYLDENIHLAIIEPSDPSDVTKIVGAGQVDIGVKAMIHTIAARARGYQVTSIGTLLDEPPTGLISLKSAGIDCFEKIVGKRIGYIGEFGKIIVNNLAHHAGIALDRFETVRVGMNMVDAIKRDVIDAGIGFSNFHQVELEAFGETTILRIDELAGLGCCCFCSIQYIAHEGVLSTKKEAIKGFLRATARAANYVTQCPDEAYELLCVAKPQLRSETYKKIFTYSLPYFSRSLFNVDRDWNKVYNYTKQLDIISDDFLLANCYRNDLLPQTAQSSVAPIVSCAV